MATAHAEPEHRPTDLQSRLQHALSTLQQELAERKYERQQHERDLADTRTTLTRVQAERDQHLRKIGELTIQFENTRDLQQQLRNIQRDQELLTAEREVLQDRVERQDEQLGELRSARDQLRDCAAVTQQEVDRLREQVQKQLKDIQYYNRVCGLAFQRLIQLNKDQLDQLPAELQEALEIYRRRIFYESTSF